MANYEHRIDHQRLIIFRDFHNEISLEEIKASWNNVLQKREFLEQNYDLVSDYRNVKLDVHLKQMSEVYRFYHQNKDQLTGSRHAVIADSPVPTAFSTFF